MMKKWNAPEVAELDIAETAGGFIKIGWEGPLDIVFGKEEEVPTNPQPEGEKPATPPTVEDSHS